MGGSSSGIRPRASARPSISWAGAPRTRETSSMRLLFIRHAIAVPRGTPGIPDDERPLTPDGEKRFRKAARGLARIAAPPEILLTSPLPRARKTAEIAAQAWGGKVRLRNV